MEEETIEIPLSEYKYMKEQLFWLECLESAGVDNWSGIDYAHDIREGREI